MRVTVILFVLHLVFGCKTSNRPSDVGRLASTNHEPPQSGTFATEIKQFAGNYAFIGPSSAVSPQHPINPDHPAEGFLMLMEDERVAFVVNFYRAARAGSYIEPGPVAILQPDGNLHTETFTVNSSGFFGGLSTEERKIETIDTKQLDQKTGELTLLRKISMSSRPYAWFSKEPWKLYKTTTVTIKVTPETLSFLEQSNDGMAQEEWTLNFKRN